MRTRNFVSGIYWPLLFFDVSFSNMSCLPNPCLQILPKDYFLIRQSPDSQLNHCFPVLVLKMKTSQTLNAPIENSTNELNRVAALARISHPLLTRLIMMMYLRRKTRLGPRAIFSNCWISAESYAAPSNGALRKDLFQWLVSRKLKVLLLFPH